MAAPKHAILIFGRFQPPTKGHERLFKTAVNKARSMQAHVYVFPSQTHDTRNPLSFDQKVRLITPSMRSYREFHIGPQSVKSPYESLTWAHETGFSFVTMYVGDDRLTDFKRLAQRWSQQEDPNGTMKIAISSLPRTGAMDASKVSGTVARQAARDGDFEAFQTVLISGVSQRDAKTAMTTIQQMHEEHTMTLEVHFNEDWFLTEDHNSTEELPTSDEDTVVFEGDDEDDDPEFINTLHAVFNEADEDDEIDAASENTEEPPAPASAEDVVVFDDDMEEEDDLEFVNTLHAVFNEPDEDESDDAVITETDEDPAIKDETLGAVRGKPIRPPDTETIPYPSPGVSVETRPEEINDTGRTVSDTPNNKSVIVISPKRHLRHDMAIRAQEKLKQTETK